MSTTIRQQAYRIAGLRGELVRKEAAMMAVFDFARQNYGLGPEHEHLDTSLSQIVVPRPLL